MALGARGAWVMEIPLAPHGAEYAATGAALHFPGSEPLPTISKESLNMIMHPEVADDLRAQALTAVSCWIHRDQEGFESVVGDDEEAAVLLPIVIGELVTALERLTGPADVRSQVDGWLEQRRERLAG